MTRAQTIKLIVFVLGTLALGAGLVVLFTRHELFVTTSNYYVRVPGSVDGVERGSAVAVRGVRVGSVEGIELYADDLESVRLTLEIARGVPIMRNAEATLALRGVTGVKFVQISGGDAREGRLAPGSYIPYQASLLERVSEQADAIAAQAGELLENTNALLSRVNSAVGRIDAQRIEAILVSAEHALQHFDAAGRDVESLVAQAKPAIQRSLTSAEAAMKTTATTAQDGRELIANLNSAVTEIRQLVRQNDGQIRVIGRNLSDATQSFKDLGRELRQRPSRLLMSSAPPERTLP